MSFDQFPPSPPGQPNPFQPPMSGSKGMPTDGTRSIEYLKQLARLQRWLVGLVGIQLLFGCVGGAGIGGLTAAMGPPVPGASPPIALMVGIGVWYLLIVAISIGTIVLLAMVGHKLWGTAGAIICGILGFMPCISLIALVVTNATATNMLQRHGYKVGFLGCNDPRLQ